MNKAPDNFQDSLHNPDYRRRYEAMKIGPETMMADRFRDCESLDGPWRFSVDMYDTCLRQGWHEGRPFAADGKPKPWDFEFDSWETMPVPSVWNNADRAYLYYEGNAVYTRTFAFEKKPGERVILKIGAAYHNAIVFLNGKQTGYHIGGDTPFYMDVTDLIGAENRIIVAVDNKRSVDRIPSYCTDWYNYGGLYRSVELYRVPKLFIRSFNVALVPGSGFGKIRASVALSEKVDSAEARLEIPELGIAASIPIRNGTGEIVLPCKPELWSPENPRLYDVAITCGTDRVRDRIGFREIAVRGTAILLNGAALKLKGISCHEDSVKNGKAVTDDEVRENCRLIKELGGNFMRLAHYPHGENAARIADEMGVLLWEEIPVYWKIRFENQTVLENARQQLTELILRDQNRASVILWSVGNENPDTDERLAFMSELAALAKKLDGTRLVTAACLWDEKNNRIHDRLAEHLDVIGINEYYGWYNPDFPALESFFRNSKPEKPVIISEMGGDALAGFRSDKGELFSEDYQETLYKEQVRCIGGTPYIAGLSPWILFDFRTPVRLNAYQKGYNRKGLLNAEKTVRKKAFYVLKEFYGRWKA